MAVCAFLCSLMRYPNLDLEDDHNSLLDMTEDAIRGGTSPLRIELEDLLDKAWSCATDDEKVYFPVVGDRIMNGSLAERIMRREDEDIKIIMNEMAESLRTNVPYDHKPEEIHFIQPRAQRALAMEHTQLVIIPTMQYHNEKRGRCSVINSGGLFLVNTGNHRVEMKNEIQM